jgi:hypothetical protein
MPLQKLQFRPGVNREGTTLTNEGGWFASNKIRFRSGQPEKVGGWERDGGSISVEVGGITTTIPSPSTGTFWGVCRSLWNWLNLAGYNLLGLGTNLKFYIQNGSGGSFYDVTPLRDTNTAVASAFTTNSTARILVNDPGHGAQTGDFVTITATSGTVNGIPAATLGTNAFPVEYQITYENSNTYYINLNPSTTLSAAISSSATSIILTSATGFPASGAIYIDSERITYTAISTNTLTGCTRATGGTAAATHSANASVTISATSSSNPAVSATFAYQITTGSDIYTQGIGWGAGGWSGTTTGYTSTGWGAAAPDGLGIGIQLRLWSQSNFGENLVFNPRGGAMYYWDVNANPTIFERGVEIKASTTVAGLAVDATCPSLVNYVLVSDASRFVIAFGANPINSAGTGIESYIDPMLIRWSDQESIWTWTPAVTNQAGDYRLSHGSQIVTAIQTRQEILVFTDAAIYSMQYLGPPYVWSFQIMGDNISLAGPNAVATANNITYWMGTDKFYMYTGRVETLPSTLRQYVYDDINLDQRYQFFASTNEGYSEVWWFYCSSGSSVIDRYVIFNHLERTWYYGDWTNYTGANSGRTAWLDTALRSNPIATAYGTPGGSTNGLLVNHEAGSNDGVVNPPTPIIASITSSDFDIGDGHNFGFIWRLIPDITFDGSEVNNPSTNFTVLPRTFPGANYGTSNDPAVTSTQNYSGQQRTYAIQQFTQQVYVRIRGRQMAFQISSGQLNSTTIGLGVQWQLGAPRIDIRPDGRR